jgi:two-component system sensor histidine kinase MprB
MITFPYQPGFAVQIAKPLDETDHSLARIRWLLIVIAIGGTLIAAGLGLIVSRAALTPVRRLTETTETVTETGDLSERIEVEGSDELSRLAISFNTMLAALEESEPCAEPARRGRVARAAHRRSRACGRTSRCSRASVSFRPASGAPTVRCRRAARTR